METIKILIILFGLLFIIERKPMNILFNFIGLIVTVAILLGKYKVEYLSYLIIIIYCSALTIIFGFVIMLTPTEDFKKVSERKIFFLAPFIIFLTFFLFNHNSFFDPSVLEIVPKNEWELTLINKIGNLLYTEEINIIKFMVSTLILLLALVALFFILMATF
jgi:NADH:ubiquinone oxidoreductase subunit 6 (subunit J)